jgi:hypothetical protein
MQDLPSAMWGLSFASSLKKLGLASGGFVNGDEHHEKTDASALKETTEGRSVLRQALTKTKIEKIELVQNHAQILSQFEERIQTETETRKQLEEELKLLKRKGREKEDKLKNRLQLAEQKLVSVTLCAK